MEKKYFLKDTALNNKEDDAFHHHDYVKNIKKLIDEHNPPFNIALIGKWGVGKSSIINLLKKELHNKSEYKIHEINAWKYENDSLKKAFLKNLWKTLNEDQSDSIWKQFGESLRQYFMDVNVNDKTHSIKGVLKDLLPVLGVLGFIFLASSSLFALVFLIWDAINAIFTENTFKENVMESFKDFKKNMWVPIIITPLYKMVQDFVKSSIQHKAADIKVLKPIETADEYEDLFKEEIKKYKEKHPDFRKLIVIVDDLDRLSPKKVVAALDAIKAFVDVDECIFIVTCDENILIRALEKEKLNKSAEYIDGELFLDKLFHFRMPLPPIIESDMKQYASELVRQEAPGLIELCEENFEEIVDILIHAEVSTPRQVKKLLNTFTNNLLIAKAREDNGRKLENSLLTGGQGLRFLAKLSVIQSDYNDVYLNLMNDFDFLDDLLSFYHAQDQNEKTVKSTIKMLFDKKSEVYRLKSDYEGIINFLIRTQHITIENIAPFIYLGQDAIGLKAGDEKQRNIRKNLVSGNEKGIISILEQEQQPENITQVVIEEVKNSKEKDLSSVLKVAYQLINHVPSILKRELANTIIYKLTIHGMNQVRFWQIESQNLLDVYMIADNKIEAEKPLVFTIDSLFNRDTNWKKISGKEMNDKEFIKQITNLLDYFLTENEKLPDSVKWKIKKFIAMKDENYNFYPFIELLHLYKKNSNLFVEYFDIDFYIQLISYMEEADDDELDEATNVFLEVSPLIRSSHIEEFIHTISVVIDIADNSLLLNILDLLEPISHHIDEISGANIVYSLSDINFENTISISRLIRKIRFNFDSVEKLKERLDTFIYNQLNQKNKSILEEMSLLIEHIVVLEKDNFKALNKVSDFLITQTFSTSLYDKIIERVNKYFTDSQRTALFNSITNTISNNYVNIDDIDRVNKLLTVLKKQEENYAYIRKSIHQGIDYLTSNSWYQYQGWAIGFLRLVGTTSNIINKDYLQRLTDTLISIADSYPDVTIKGLMYVGNNMPEERIEESLNIVISKAITDSNKLDVLYFLKSVRDQFTEANYNVYIDFLITNIYLEPKGFLDELYSQFDSISKAQFIDLIRGIESMKDKHSEDYDDVIRRVVNKFYTGLVGIEEKYALLEALLQSSISEETIQEVLLNSINKNAVAEVLTYAINPNIDYGDRERQRKLLKLCASHHKALKKNHLTSLIVNMMREKDDDYIKELCDILLVDFIDFKFVHEKRHVHAQIVPTFRSVNMETKEKVLELAKSYDMTREFEKAVKEKTVSVDEIELIESILLTRKKRSVSANS
ncbi:KAP family P-loop NTPase fold protein [Bacillus sp. II_CA]|uniref:KAP family P-loop NTPase fold protein n=1 Tax=Bacillus sp. II_CA TaxID=3417451 RepID=UPI003CF0575D